MRLHTHVIPMCLTAPGAYLMTCRTLSQDTATPPAFPVTVRPALRNTRSKRPLGCKSWTFSRVKSTGAVLLLLLLLVPSVLSLLGARACPFVDDVPAVRWIKEGVSSRGDLDSGQAKVATELRAGGRVVFAPQAILNSRLLLVLVLQVVVFVVVTFEASWLVSRFSCSACANSRQETASAFDVTRWHQPKQKRIGMYNDIENQTRTHNALCGMKRTILTRASGTQPPGNP